VRSRILKSRFVYRDKNAGTGSVEIAAKARLCVHGCGDPDLEMLQRDSPTVQKVFVHLLLQVCASNKWERHGADAKSAFMQGGAAPERTKKLYMRQPKDGVAKSLPGVELGALLEIVGSVYGLVNSPRL